MVVRLSALRTGRLLEPVRGWVGRILCQWKIPTQAGIEPATFRFVAQHLNHCATAVPWLLQTMTKLFSYDICVWSHWPPGHALSTSTYTQPVLKPVISLSCYNDETHEDVLLFCVAGRFSFVRSLTIVTWDINEVLQFWVVWAGGEGRGGIV